MNYSKSNLRVFFVSFGDDLYTMSTHPLRLSDDVTENLDSLLKDNADAIISEMLSDVSVQAYNYTM